MDEENGQDQKQFLENFHTKGYTINEYVFSPEELDELHEIAKTLIEGANHEENQNNDGHWNSQGYLFNKPPSELSNKERAAKHLHKIQGVGTVDSKVLEKVFKHPKIVSVVQNIMYPKPNEESKESDTTSEEFSNLQSIDVFGTKFFPVFPGGNSVHWHQDSHYFGTGPSQKIISVAVYIEKTDIENGCLRLIPSSHSDGFEYPHQQGTGKWTQGEWVDVDSNTNLKSKIVEVICPQPGTVILFDARLLHAANENQSLDRTRWSFFGHYVPGDLNFSWRGIDFGKEVYKDRYVIIP